MGSRVSTRAFDDLSEPVAGRITVGLAKIGLALRSQAWKAAEDQGLTPTQGQILAFLRARPDRAIRLSEVAAGLAITPATASDAVAALVRKGLVHKGRAADDSRAIALSLTPEGEGEAERIAAWPDFLLRAVDTLSPEEQEVLLRALVKMIRTLQQRGEIPVSRMCVSCRYFQPNAYEDPEAPHHCAFVDAPFGDRHLRLDCLDHQAAPLEQQSIAWAAFAGGRKGGDGRS